MPLTEYYQALERLKNGRQKIVAKGMTISNDAVSIEAGRKKGSIKKSRAIFKDLIADIDAAALDQNNPKDVLTNQLKNLKKIVKSLREQFDASLARELSLVAELYDSKKRLGKLLGENVLPIRRKESDAEHLDRPIG